MLEEVFALGGECRGIADLKALMVYDAPINPTSVDKLPPRALLVSASFDGKSSN